MIPLDDDPLTEPPSRFRLGNVVKCPWSETEWKVVGVEDGKEGAETVYELVGVVGGPGSIRLGYGALRFVRERR